MVWLSSPMAFCTTHTNFILKSSSLTGSMTRALPLLETLIWGSVRLVMFLCVELAVSTSHDQSGVGLGAELSLSRSHVIVRLWPRLAFS